MTDQELLKAIRTIVQEENKPIKERLEKLEEGQAEVRSGVNTLLRWAEKVGDSIDFPLPKII